MSEPDRTESQEESGNAAEGGGRARATPPHAGASGGAGESAGGSAGDARRRSRRRGRRARRRTGETRAGEVPRSDSAKPARRKRRAGAGPPDEATRPNRLGTTLLVLAAAGLAVAAFFVFRPFLTTLIAAVLITTVSYPLFTRVLSFVGSERRGLASALTCLLVILLVVLPALLCGWQMANEARQRWFEEAPPAPPADNTAGSATESAAESAADGVSEESGRTRARELWDRFRAAVIDEVERQVRQLRRDLRVASLAPGAGEAEVFGEEGVPPGGETPGGGAAATTPGEEPAFPISTDSVASVVRWVTRVLGSLLAGVLGVLIQGLLMLFIMFYFYRDGPRILGSVQHALAVDPEYQEKMIEKFKVVSVGMMRGILATALVQGILGGIAFFFLGFPAFLFGSLIALCALVPIAGTGLVTVPATIYLIVEGMYVHAAVAAVIAFGIAGLDNVLRPWLVEGDLKLHPVWILLSILGGVGCFGPLGLILGPMVVVLLRTVLELVAEESGKRANRRSLSPGRER